MQTDCKTSKKEGDRAPPRLATVASPTRSVTIRLPVDLYEHLQDAAHAGSGDVTKALIAVIRQHRDGSQGAEEVGRLASGVGELTIQMEGICNALGNLHDEITLVRGSQGKTLKEVARTLNMLFILLRDSEQVVESEQSGNSGRTSVQPDSEFGGTAEMPVARIPGMRPVPTPFGSAYR